jgi:hypothetical protein
MRDRGDFGGALLASRFPGLLFVGIEGDLPSKEVLCVASFQFNIIIQI